MKVAVGTTTSFHLRELAAQLSCREGIEVDYYTSLPRYRVERDGIGHASLHSLFIRSLPSSALALARRNPKQKQSVERMLEIADYRIRDSIDHPDVYIGLSSMAVESAKRAREQGALVVIERGSRHVLSQREILQSHDGAGLTEFYVDRELASYEQADYISVLSHHAKQSFIDNGWPSDRVLISPLGVNLDRFQPAYRELPAEPRILFVGGWSVRKGVDLLVRAIDEMPDVHVTHVGSPAGAAFPDAHPRVATIGHLTHDQLAIEMASHDLLVLPSREDGFGMVILEALAAGLPVVASDMTAASDIRLRLSEPAWVEVVKSNDVPALRDGLRTMIQRIRSMQSVDRSRARLSLADRASLSWQSYGVNYATQLRDLVSRK